MYYPNGFTFKNNEWKVKCNMSNSLPNHGCEWNNPVNWTSGYKEGEYIEVTHSQNNPGMAQSVGFWFNGLPGGGSGIFFQIGKTFVGNNKVDTLFLLLDKLKSSTIKDLELQMSATKYKNKSGSEILKSSFDTDDPYVITWKYVNGEWPGMAKTSNNNTQSFLVNPRDDAWAYVGNKGILSASGLMNDKDSIKVNGQDGNGYKPNLTVKFEDIATWWVSKKKLGKLTANNKKLVIDAARNPVDDIDYFPNRAGGMVPPDEPIAWLSFVLGIETIQMPMSANDNGLWCYEIIDYRLPTPTNTP
jgi:hypothetical protein